MAGAGTTRRVRLGAWATTLVVSATGCGDDRGSGATVTASPSASIAPSAASPAPGASSAAPAASTAPASPASPWTGSWAGTYRAEKATPTLDPTVKVKPWTSDDGKRGSGEGELRIDVGPEGEAKGELLGPLGPADVLGVVEGERLLARFVPREEGEAAFAGTVEGTIADGQLSFTIRASDGEAVTVRKAAGKLKR